MLIDTYVILTPQRCMLNGKELPCEADGAARLSALYRDKIGDYPKFFKMDALSKVGFVASELLLQYAKAMGWHPVADDATAILLFNHTASLNADNHFQETIADGDDFFPSPALFVYTLPNIVTGEIAIRNRFYGETNFMVLATADAKTMAEQMVNAFQDPATETVIGGWLDCVDEEHYDARLFMLRRNNATDVLPLQEEIATIMNENAMAAYKQ